MLAPRRTPSAPRIRALAWSVGRRGRGRAARSAAGQRSAAAVVRQIVERAGSGRRRCWPWRRAAAAGTGTSTGPSPPCLAAVQPAPPWPAPWPTSGSPPSISPHSERARAGGDIFLIVALLLVVAGLVIYPLGPRRRTDLTRMVLDGVVLGGSVLLIAGDTLFPQILDQSGPTVAERVAPLVIPVIDLILATVGWLLFLRGSRARSADPGHGRRRLRPVRRLRRSSPPSHRAQGALLVRHRRRSRLDRRLRPARGRRLAGRVRGRDPAAPSVRRARPPWPARWSCSAMFVVAAVPAPVHGRRGDAAPPSMPCSSSCWWRSLARQMLLTFDNEGSGGPGAAGHRTQHRAARGDPADRPAGRLRRRRRLRGRRPGPGDLRQPGRARLPSVSGDATSSARQAHAPFHDHNADRPTRSPIDEMLLPDRGDHRRLAISGVEDVYRDAEGRLMPVEVTASPLADGRASAGCASSSSATSPNGARSTG